ncbi:tRNA pseudouridine(55) synthase [Ranunculus cassubicifolius]
MAPIEEETTNHPILSSSSINVNEDSAAIAASIKYLPPIQPIQDLLSKQVCVRCILRLFGVRGTIYSYSSLSPSSLCSAIEKSNSTVENDSNSCSICLGILQFCSTSQGEEISVKKNQVCDFTESIAKIVKREGFQISDFAIEISVPQIILDNQTATWLYMRMKYGSEPWFQEQLHVSVKDALKLSITKSLETFLDAKYGASSFHIHLKYTENKTLLGNSDSLERNQDHKRRKTGIEDNLNNVAVAEFDNGEVRVILDSKHDVSTLDQVKEPCLLMCHCYRTPTYIGGRYLKYSRNVSQTRWIIDDERKGEASVEEIIGNAVVPLCRGDSYKFHAAGREDIDVRMLGSGRPFLIEIQNARQEPSKLSTTVMEDKINNSEDKLVRVRNVKVVGIEGWNLMREGETEKQKQYAALVWISRPLKDEDLQTICSLEDMKILQRTPVRVLHRRSPLDREKVIHWMKVERIIGSSQYFLLHLCTQAGTYIKEFVHGDLGRTQPSIGSLLGCRAEILQLDVTDVKMDYCI